jgi:hypothetical protein
MDWLQGVFNLLSACIGGGIAILVQRFNSRDEARLRSEDALAQQYTDFLVAFHAALIQFESFYESVSLQDERGCKAEHSAEGWKARNEAARCFRESVWRLRVRERDPEQKRLLEEMARVFDTKIEEFDMRSDIARDYHQTATELRGKAISIIDRMQENQSRGTASFKQK